MNRNFQLGLVATLTTFLSVSATAFNLPPRNNPPVDDGTNNDPPVTTPDTPSDSQWNDVPPDMVDSIELTWKEMTGGFEGRTGARPRSASIAGFYNTILDQVMQNNGTLNYCVRYESDAPVSARLRDDIEMALNRNVNAWFEKLTGYNGFPHTKIDVKVVGWAVRNRSVLQWNDNSVPVYVGDYFEGAPQCAQVCGRFFHQQPGYNYPQCPGGKANHYDQSLWLTEGMNGGAGGDWGQRVGRAYFTDRVNTENLHIFLHEMGHGLGFPDYYNWRAWTQSTPEPYSVMVAGAAFEVTDWDRWMFRYTWDRLKSRW